MSRLSELLALGLWLLLGLAVAICLAAIMAWVTARNATERLLTKPPKGKSSSSNNSPSGMPPSPPRHWMPSGKSRSDIGQ